MSTAEKFEVLQAELDQALAEILKLKRQLEDQNGRLNVVEGENGRLRELLRLARDSHGVMWLTDPPQDPWKVRQISEQITKALENRS